MDGATLQKRVYRGYAIAAPKIGLANDLYRPSSALNPLAAGNKITTLPASYNAEDMKFSKPNKYGKPTWYVIVDGAQTRVFDYLKGPQGTFFIAAQQAILPILAVECNRTINVLRAQQESGIGAQPYSGNTSATESILMQQWPASVLQGTKGEKSESALPGDVRMAWWQILLPYFAGVVLRSDDIVTDDLNRRYVLSSVELSDLGWRCTAMQAQT